MNDVFRAELRALFEVREDFNELLDVGLGAYYFGDLVIFGKVKLQGRLEEVEGLGKDGFY